MTKYRIYIFSLWLATCSMLLSTVMLHHHHFDKICFVEEKCTEDGNTNDEHTEHQEKEQDGCQIHQMHKFLLNVKVVKSINKHIMDGGHSLVAVLPSPFQYIPYSCLLVTQWQEHTCPLASAEAESLSRRGPPSLS